MTPLARRRTPWLAALIALAAGAGGADASRPAGARAASPSCAPAQRREALREAQAEVTRAVPLELPSLDKATAEGGPLERWQLSHGHVVLAGAGGVAVHNLEVPAPLPQVLIYAPSATSAPESWLDFDGEEGPYRLVGWAYLGPYTPGSSPPARPCVAPSEWWVHEAGWHLMNGGMVLTPDASTEPPRRELGSEVYFWHPAVWDVHFWLGEDGVPEVTLHNPGARRGGLDLPEAAFFRFVNGRREAARPPSLP